MAFGDHGATPNNRARMGGAPAAVTYGDARHRRLDSDHLAMGYHCEST